MFLQFGPILPNERSGHVQYVGRTLSLRIFLTPIIIVLVEVFAQLKVVVLDPYFKDLYFSFEILKVKTIHGEERIIK